MVCLVNELRNMLHNRKIWMAFLILLFLNGVFYVLYINADTLDHSTYRDMCNRINTGELEIGDIFMEAQESGEAQDIIDEYMAVADYDIYLEKVQTEADNNRDISIFQSRYSINNIEKTKQAYAKLKGVQPEFFGSRGICRFFGYYGMIIVVVIFAAVLSIEGVMRDKKNGLLNLYKTTRKGDSRLVIGKYLASAIILLLMWACVYVSDIFITEIMYGAVDKSLPVQSLADYIDFGYRMNIYQFMLADFLCKYIGILAVISLIMLMNMISANEAMAFVKCIVIVALAGAASGVAKLAGNELGYRVFGGSIFNSERFFGYLNYNIFNNAVSAIMVDIIIFVVIIVVGICISCVYFMNKEIYYNQIMIGSRLKARLFGGYRIRGLGALESYKLWIGYKMIFVLLLLVFIIGYMYYGKTMKWGISEIYYRYYVNQIAGDVTEEKMDYLESEKENFDKLRLEYEEVIQKYDAGEISYDKYNRANDSIQEQLNKEPGFDRCREYVEYVVEKNKDNDGAELGFVYDRGYDLLIGDKSVESRRLNAIMFLTFGFIILSFMYLSDYKDKINELVMTTEKYRTLDRIKTIKSVVVLVFAYVAIYGTEFLWITKNIDLEGSGYSIYSLYSMRESAFNVTILQYLIIGQLVRILIFALLSVLFVFIGKKVKNTFYMLGGALLIVVLPLVFMYVSGM